MRRYVLMISVAALLPVAHLGAGQESGGTIQGKAEVVDGDSLRLGGVVVRLWGIDAIEKRNPLGKESTEVLREMIQGRPVQCRQRDTDRHGRPVAKCFVEETDLGAEMVRRGWAGAYIRFTKEYQQLEAAARAACRGVWRALRECAR